MLFSKIIESVNREKKLNDVTLYNTNTRGMKVWILLEGGKFLKKNITDRNIQRERERKRDIAREIRCEG